VAEVANRVKVTLKQPRADELIRIGSGGTTVEKVRAAKAESVRKVRAQKSVLRSTGSEEPKRLAIEAPKEPADPTATDEAKLAADKANLRSPEFTAVSRVLDCVQAYDEDMAVAQRQKFYHAIINAIAAKLTPPPGGG